MRFMKLKAAGMTIYQSSFDPKTGTIVRETELWEVRETITVGGHTFTSHREAIPYEVREIIQERFPHRYQAIPSPSPELIDVGITNRCSMGCSYCYTNSRPRLRHAPKELVPKLLKGLATPPYQIAIGGGEPTQHPDFIWILEQARKLGTVPNYTTAGLNITNKLIEASNALCGGVALTYHAWKGFEWFAERYRRLHDRLTCQLNVHLIADTDVVANLRALVDLQEQVGPINLVLLAYYPDVGRASLDRLMSRTTYSRKLPNALSYAKAMGMQIAFSEGLLPFFLSRPELGVDTTFAIASEGLYSCYVSPKGFMYASSFNADEASHFPKQETVLKGGQAQRMWEQLRHYSNHDCDGCAHSSRCSAPHSYHRLLCKHEQHNHLPLKTAPAEYQGKTAYERLMEDN
jgi:hypothetical protein